MHLLFSADDPTATGELDEERLQQIYRHRLPQGRPVWLRSNFVTSLDGSISGADGRSGSINTPSDQHVFALHRAHADVVLVGAQTARTEGYRGVDLAPWQRELRARQGLPDLPLLAVVTRSLDVDPGIVGNGDLEVGPVMVLTGEQRRPEVVRRLTDAGIEVVQLPGPAGVDLEAATAHLASTGRTRVLCEGGPRLHRDLAAADLLDEMSLTLAPVVVGGDGGRTTAGQPLRTSPGFRLSTAIHADDGTLFLSYVRQARPQSMS